MSRRLALTGALAVALVAIAAFALLGGGDEVSLNPIAQAAERSQESPGARVSLRGVVRGSSAPQPIEMSGEGLLDNETDRVSATLTMHTPTDDIEMEMVTAGTTAYMRSELFESHLPGGAEWVSYDVSLGTSSETAFAGESDPAAQLDMLRGVSDEFETLGPQEIRGVETTGYRSLIDPDANAERLRDQGSEAAAELYERVVEKTHPTTEIETWIDAEGLVRRTRMKLHSEDPESGEKSSFDMTMDFFDYGTVPVIQLPDPDSVYDMTPLIEKELELDGSG